MNKLIHKFKSNYYYFILYKKIYNYSITKKKKKIYICFNNIKLYV